MQARAANLAPRGPGFKVLEGRLTNVCRWVSRNSGTSGFAPLCRKVQPPNAGLQDQVSMFLDLEIIASGLWTGDCAG